MLSIVAGYLQSFLDDEVSFSYLPCTRQAVTDAGLHLQSEEKQVVCSLDPLLPTLWMLLEGPQLSEDMRTSYFSSLLSRANSLSTIQAPLPVRAALFDFLAKTWLVCMFDVTQIAVLQLNPRCTGARRARSCRTGRTIAFWQCRDSDPLPAVDGWPASASVGSSQRQANVFRGTGTFP